MDSERLRAFQDEITKSAAMPRALMRAAGRVISESPGHGALIGAGAGALGGVATRGEGESALSAGLRGGVMGAAVGGAGAGIGRAYRDTHLLARDAGQTLGAGQATVATAKRLGQGVVNFGKRQLHGLTGAYADKAGDIGMRWSAEAAKRQKVLDLRLADRIQGGARAGEGKADKLLKKHHEASQELADWGRRGDQALQSGITSIPGVAKGLVERPGHTVKALGREMLAGGGLGAGAMSVGLPLAIAAPDLARGDESAHGGRSMREKVVNAGSGLVGGALTAGMPVIPQIGAGMVVDSLANRALARRRRLAPAAPNTQQITGVPA